MKLSLFSLYTTLFTLPFAIRKVFWRNEGEYFNEYSDISVYFFEIFALLTILLFILEHKNKIKSINRKYINVFHVEHLILLALLFIPTIAFTLMSNFVYPLFLLLKWCIYIGFSICLYYYLSKIVPRGTNKLINCSTWNNLTLLIAVSLLIQAIIVILQVLKQKSVGLYLLGEQIISPVISGVSTIIINESEYLRGYGTFLHPNVVAFFFLAYGIFLYILIKNVPRGTNWQQNCSTWNNYSIFFNKLFHVEQLSTFLSHKVVPRGTIYAFFMIIGIGLILTFSKSVIISVLIIFLISVFVPRGTNGRNVKLFHVEQFIGKYRNSVPRGTLLVCSIISACYVIYVSVDWNTYLNQSILERKLQYLSIPYTTFSQLILGHGLGSYTFYLAEKSPGLFFWQIQPIHNSYILAIFELGLLPIFTIVIWLLWKGRVKTFFVKRVKNVYEYFSMIFLGTVLILFAIDHYMWDIEQGQFLFCVFLTLTIFLKNFRYQNTINRV